MMLSAPVSENKAKEQPGKTESEPEMDGFIRSGGWAGYGSFGLGGGRLAAVAQPLGKPGQQAAMQKVYGNQAMLRMMNQSPAQAPVTASPLNRGGILHRKCACGNTAGASGSCAECEEKGGMGLPGTIQTKLTVNQPGDRFEQEADCVAEQVMRIPQSTIQRQVGFKQATKVFPSPITHLRHRSSTQDQHAEVPPIVNEVLQSPSQSLDTETRLFMESRFGYDFSQVRVHTDTKAAESADAVNALAYVVDQNVVFGRGQYKPRTTDGQRLIAHELTHTIQQQQNSPPIQSSVDFNCNNSQQQQKAKDVASTAVQWPSTIISHIHSPQLTRQATKDAGVDEEAPRDTSLPGGVETDPNAVIPGEAPANLPGGVETDPNAVIPGEVPTSLPGGVEIPPSPSVSVPSPHICGPDIDLQLTKVLGDMQTHFRSLSNWQKHKSCQWLITPPMAIMAWDIHQLFLPETAWLRSSPFSPACGQPPGLVDVEDPTSCGNSVRAGGKCNLAGTVNYATFGIMTKECHTFYSSAPILSLWKGSVVFFTETGMKSFIGLYKTVTFDDAGPPTEFAEATYRGGPSARPSTENRKHCSTACGAKATPPAFTFVWEPEKAR